MYFDDLRDQICDLVEEMLSDATETNAATFGLDRRAGHRLWLTAEHDAIVVPKTGDATLQYYGGFEYVDKDCRHEFGEYVFYSVEDARVQKCIDRAIDAEEESELTPGDVAAIRADLANDAKKCGE